VFEKFLDKTVIKKESFFPDNASDEVFTADVLSQLVKCYVKDYIGGNDREEKLKRDLKKDRLSFEDKAKSQLKKIANQYQEKAKIVFGNLMWLQYLPATKPKSDKDKGDSYGKSKCEQIKELTGLEVSYNCDGRAKYGMAAMRLDDDLTDLILLFNELVGKQWEGNDDKLESIKNYIIKWCLDLKEDDSGEKGIRETAYDQLITKERKCPADLLPLHNMLLHLCNKDQYLPIAVSGHKKKIVDTFEGLIEKKNGEIDLKEADAVVDDAEEINKKIFCINKKLNPTKASAGQRNIFYQPEYKFLWDLGNDNNYSDINALKFKKAIILYGPPGTSKTYTATQLAKSLIFRKEYKGDAPKFLKEKAKIEKQIHWLQLHPNYTYEDFIWGYQIKNKEYKDNGKLICVGNQTVAKKGYFLNLLDDINKKEGKPHVLILDEINRVDLSRLFGELFSAIENRNEAVELPVTVEGTKSVKIPENLYIIGTMNEIDFSLERVDFALRRRFSWFPYGYNATALKEILENKLNKEKVSGRLKTFKDNDEEKSAFIDCCSALNDAIDADENLGKQYQIGHTFFAELVDIWKDMQNYEIQTVKSILWNISIGPMIEAYLGNSDAEKIKPLKEAFGISSKKSN
jgi:5-methylcytosine-specific restriction protein B